MSTPNTSKHAAFKELPIVDITKLFSDSLPDRVEVAETLDKATRDAGFFYLKGHQIPDVLISNLKSVTKTYFSQSTDAKMADYIGHSNNHSGYVPQGEEVFYGASADLKEAYDIGPESSSLMARFEDKGKNQWPKDAVFKHAISEYYRAMLNLSRTLFRGFALALNLPEHSFTQHLSIPPSQLRLIHYFDNPNAKETDSGIGAHTDYEFFTILLPTSPGLQAMNGAGEWINIPLIDDCFIINIGDMMEVVSGGEYVATSHRVRQVKEERYAFPFFSSLDYDTIVKPLPGLGKQSEQEDIEPIVCGDHLLAQTMQTFSYLKNKFENGDITLPYGSKSLSSFGQLAATGE